MPDSTDRSLACGYCGVQGRLIHSELGCAVWCPSREIPNRPCCATQWCATEEEARDAWAKLTGNGFEGKDAERMRADVKEGNKR